jgi:hypothetical protein
MKSNSKQLTSAIIAALFLIVALVVYFEMIVPAYASLQKDKGQAQSQQALLDNEKKVVDQVKKLIDAYKSEASSTQAIGLALPVGQNTAGALAQIYGIANNAGFSIQSTGVTTQAITKTTATPAAGANIKSAATTGSIAHPAGTVSFQIIGNGSYESLKTFLAGLENNIRFFDVTGISIQEATLGKGSIPDNFNYTITVVTYYQSS